jgi:hypothetical protein
MTDHGKLIHMRLEVWPQAEFVIADRGGLNKRSKHAVLLRFV